jgi:hypothetical protein
LADLKYGIIVVPVGQEMLLFGEKPDNDLTQRIIDAVNEAKQNLNPPRGMYDLDKDSDEFRHERFEPQEEAGNTATGV